MITKFVQSIWDRMKTAGFVLWQGSLPLGKLLGLFGVLLVGWWIFADSKDDPVENVGRAWSESIARLGIRPLFPPTEDFHVGDIYAVLRQNDRRVGDPVATDGRLADRSIRVGWMNLNGLIADHQKMRPILQPLQPSQKTPTPVAMAGASGAPEIVLSQQRAVTEDDPVFAVTVQEGSRILLTRLLFPGITIAVSHGAGLGDWLRGLTGGASRQEDEVIKIDNPMTYGVDPEYAFSVLGQFCGEPKPNNPRCDSDYLRRLIAAQFGREVCLSGKNATYGIELMLVSRVFVSKGIAVDRGQDIRLRFQSLAAETTDGAMAQENTGDQLAKAKASQLVGIPSQGGAYRRYSNLASSHTQPRPLTFGYHAVSIRADSFVKETYRCS